MNTKNFKSIFFWLVLATVTMQVQESQGSLGTWVRNLFGLRQPQSRQTSGAEPPRHTIRVGAAPAPKSNIKLMHFNGNVPEDVECPFCLQSPTDPVLLCGNKIGNPHLACTNCSTKWIAFEIKANHPIPPCPFCREPLLNENNTATNHQAPSAAAPEARRALVAPAATRIVNVAPATPRVAAPGQWPSARPPLRGTPLPQNEHLIVRRATPSGQLSPTMSPADWNNPALWPPVQFPAWTPNR